jgi:O-antigen/teichoic acid export membrane protein
LLRVLISIFLFAVYFDVLSPQEFIFALMGIYFLSLIAMFLYAMKVKTPRFNLVFPDNAKAVLTYCFFIILSGSVANMLLDVDKFMLNFYINIDNIAFYSVAIFIATVIAVPSRAMHQITYPITAKLMSENKQEELNELYKKSSITLQVIGGLILVGILVNINELYSVLPAGYSEGIAVVFFIGISKYFDLVLGNNNAIIFNSKYYQAVLFLGLFLVFMTVSLNMIFIPLYGLNGAAIATLISISLYSLAKLLFVVLKMKLFPFTKNTIVALIITILSFGMFYYWDFSFHPFVNIILKSILVTIFYLGLSYYLKISSDINFVMNSVFKRILKK